MADTLGSLIDKLLTVDLKMWNNQELLYEIRKMSFTDFKEKYLSNDESAKKLWQIFKKSCDLNVQRNAMIDQIDEFMVEILNDKFDGKNLDDGKYIQRKHKTY